MLTATRCPDTSLSSTTLLTSLSSRLGTEVAAKRLITYAYTALGLRGRYVDIAPRDVWAVRGWIADVEEASEGLLSLDGRRDVLPILKEAARRASRAG